MSNPRSGRSFPNASTPILAPGWTGIEVALLCAFWWQSPAEPSPLSLSLFVYGLLFFCCLVVLPALLQDGKASGKCILLMWLQMFCDALCISPCGIFFLKVRNFFKGYDAVSSAVEQSPWKMTRSLQHLPTISCGRVGNLVVSRSGSSSCCLLW